MKITFSDAGKRFNRDWIFRRLTYDFLPGERFAITGANGSGKSTLLQVIAGNLEVNAGQVSWHYRGQQVEHDAVFSHIAIAAPYLDLIEEMTTEEFLAFHSRFKPLLSEVSIPQIIDIIGLTRSAKKQIRYFSSGMKQRLKLAQAIFADTPLLLLDEPCTNLDAAGIQLYHHLIKTYAAEKTIVVSSNDETEYSFCQHHLSVMDYK